MSVTAIARHHFEAAVREAEAAGESSDALARSFLGLVVAHYLKARSIEDVRSELMFLAENCDPETDFPFMRP
jgi:hypothetical protein